MTNSVDLQGLGIQKIRVNLWDGECPSQLQTQPQ